VVARVSRYRFPPEGLSAVVAEIRAAVHANPRGYDRRIQAAFLFAHRESGEAVALTVASERDALDHAPAEPPAAILEEVQDYDVTEVAVSSPPEGVHMFAVLAPFRLGDPAGRRPAFDDQVRAGFLLESEKTGSALRIAVGEDPEALRGTGAAPDARRYEMEYLLLHDALRS
jgi:hypothetical protein